MKIGIITTTFENFGSRLQNLATIELLKTKYPNAKINTIVLCKEKNRFFTFLSKLTIFNKILLKIKFSGKINKNNNLLNYKLFFIKNFAIESLQFLNNIYDLFVIGSDQIWNYTGSESNYRFGLFTKNKICNSPSIIFSDSIDQSKVFEYLKTFDDLNVREQKSCDYINKHGVKCRC